MDECNGGGHVIEENHVQSIPPQAHSGAHRYLNGQCVLSVSSGSILNPGFDLEMCRSGLEMNGFQIPESELEIPLRTALDVPSVKRYITFNSSMFHFLMAPLVYVVLWCAVFSTLHLYLTVTDYWVLCLCVSLVAIFLTTAIIFVLHRSNKEINMNLDVRLIAVNESLVKHKLLVAVADWVESCTSNLQLYFVYWDMSRCLRALTETLEQSQSQIIQKKLQKRLSHLVLVSEALRRRQTLGRPKQRRKSEMWSRAQTKQASAAEPRVQQCLLSPHGGATAHLQPQPRPGHSAVCSDEIVPVADDVLLVVHKAAGVREIVWSFKLQNETEEKPLQHGLFVSVSVHPQKDPEVALTSCCSTKILL
ncbi:hypothetical protein WMY93_015600 [Mugilogobius chulae]|uniref:Transmembrane protein 268 n=1 Tax=Mugilogobius chulae TaxID=88201 RepID=A0AAW0NX10_9GOBI